MRRIWPGTVLTFLLVVVSARTLAIQEMSTTSFDRDPEALGIVAKALKAAGGATALSTIHDITASGIITYYWAGEEVKGSVTVKGRGISQFRLDASLPDGVRSWAVSNGTGFVKETDGTVRQIPGHNTLNFGNLTFPLSFIATVAQDPSFSVNYIGLEAKDESSVYHIRTQKIFSSRTDPSGILTKLTIRDFYIDSVSFQLVSTSDMVHPTDASTVDYPREMQFSNYRAVNGVLVPFTVAEVATGQRTYLIQLDQVTFNSGLQDPDFAQ
jgi:hypothetical protein